MNEVLSTENHIERSRAKSSKLKLWAVDPLEKVFRDALPEKSKEAVAEVARGEHATLQIVVRSDNAITGLTATMSPLNMECNKEVALNKRIIRFVGYVPIIKLVETPPQAILREPPADFPDPLLEVETITVIGGEAQPIWITIPVPPDAVPGIYRGDLTVCGTVEGRKVKSNHPLMVQVYNAKVSKTRLWVTNWYRMEWWPINQTPELYSKEYWNLMRRIARNMAEHRQNVAWVSPFDLAEISQNNLGELVFDFSTFDKWVALFIEEGVIGRIEGQHIGERKIEGEFDWGAPFIVKIRTFIDGKLVESKVDPTSTEADRFYSRFFPSLVDHLRQKGWLEIYMQHLADEPVNSNAESYVVLAGLVRKYAPELPFIEACHNDLDSKNIEGTLQVWVPVLDLLEKEFEFYQGRMKKGEEVWFYTCWKPEGEYANRFIEQHLIKTRILHWINYRYGSTGYLHWGYNWWGGEASDPFNCATRNDTPVPGGDPWIVYPGNSGPLDSIRFEAMRDGIVDHELLSMLAEHNREAADNFASLIVHGFDKYNLDIEMFRKTRRELLKVLSEN